MSDHLKKWWIAYGGGIMAATHSLWPPMREYVCSHPKISGATFLSIIVTALLKTSPTDKVVNG